jgi:hypothetical protein
LTYDPAGKLLSLCTGTLVTPSEVLTAGQCVAPLEKCPGCRVEVACGYGGNKDREHIEATAAGVPIYLDGPRFNERPLAARAGLSRSYAGASKAGDLGMIELGKSSKIRPLALVAKDELAQYFDGAGKPKPGVECLASGFGLGADKPAGELRAFDVPAHLEVGMDAGLIYRRERRKLYEVEESEAAGDAVARYSAGKLPLRSLVREVGKLLPADGGLALGDLGGGLYCRLSKSAEWKLMGVNAGVELFVERVDGARSSEVRAKQSWTRPMGTGLKPIWRSPKR